MKWALVGLAVLAILLPISASETNYWPFFVQQVDSPVGRMDQTTSLGPIYSLKESETQKILSIRPFWTSFHDPRTGQYSAHFLYPLLNWKDAERRDSGDILVLASYKHNDPNQRTSFVLFPFIFADYIPKDDASYFAFFPFGGVVRDRLWRDRISFALWPLYVQTERDDEVRTHFPYPFLHTLDGPQSRGFGIWPIYVHEERDNDYDHTWAAWPFYYDHKDKLNQAVPYERFGVLPFYSREKGDGLISETYAWPFFGYTREAEPRPAYAEKRYFWPFLVQGRGVERHVNRWMPIFTHETKPNREKVWILWPIFNAVTIREPGLVRERTSLLYFVYREEKQHFTNTTASKATLWPFVSYWNNGTGQKQLQMLDPLTAFFPRNEKVRENWTPLFALYRFDERDGNRRHSVLWDFVVWERDPEGLRTFYVGPLFEWVEGSHWDVLKGLVGSTKKEDGRKVRFFWKR